MTALTPDEFQALLTRVSVYFAAKSYQELVKEVYGLRTTEPKVGAQKLWLYLYALNSWDNTPGAENYLTLPQMLHIITKVQPYVQ